MKCKSIKEEITLVDEIEIKVRFSEIDSMRVVWHGEYVKYFEDGREAFGLKYFGLGYKDIAESEYFTPMVDLHIRYIKPLIINDIVCLETKYIYTPGAKICFHYTLTHKSSGEVIAYGDSVQVFTNRQGVLTLNSPEFYKKWQEKWLKI